MRMGTPLLSTWVAAAAGLLVVFVLAYRRFLLDLDRPTRWAFLGGGGRSTLCVPWGWS